MKSSTKPMKSNEGTESIQGRVFFYIRARRIEGRSRVQPRNRLGRPPATLADQRPERGPGPAGRQGHDREPRRGRQRIQQQARPVSYDQTASLASDAVLAFEVRHYQFAAIAHGYDRECQHAPQCLSSHAAILAAGASGVQPFRRRMAAAEKKMPTLGFFVLASFRRPPSIRVQRRAHLPDERERNRSR